MRSDDISLELFSHCHLAITVSVRSACFYQYTQLYALASPICHTMLLISLIWFCLWAASHLSFDRLPQVQKVLRTSVLETHQHNYILGEYSSRVQLMVDVQYSLSVMQFRWVSSWNSHTHPCCDNLWIPLYNFLIWCFTGLRNIGSTSTYFQSPSQSPLTTSYPPTAYTKQEEASSSQYSYEKALYVAANQYFLNKKVEASRGGRGGGSTQSMRGGRGRGGARGGSSYVRGFVILGASH